MTIDIGNLISGDEAVALAALDGGVALGTGYPGTPSTEILEAFSELGGKAQWAPNEKVALEVAVGVAFAGARALATMKHVGLNVAADVLFTVAYSGIDGGLVVVSADDPGMSSSQNEQDNRRYAVAAGVPMLEPADSQEAYDLTLAAFEISHRWQIPVMLRMTTRVCHGKSILRRRRPPMPAPPTGFRRDIRGRVMVPAHARPAHRRLRRKLAEIAQWSEACEFNSLIPGAATASGSGRVGVLAHRLPAHTAADEDGGRVHPPCVNPPDSDAEESGSSAAPQTRRRGQTDAREALSQDKCRNNATEEPLTPALSPAYRGERETRLGIIASGVAYLHAREAAPEASFLKLAVTYPLPMEMIRRFAAGVGRCLVVEEGDPYLVDAIGAAGVAVEGKSGMYRFGELNVTRVRRIVARDDSPEPPPLKGKPPELCPACPYREPFGVLRKLDCIVAGDIGCYTLGAFPPLEAMDSQLCMGASLGVGLGLRHVLPEEQARRVVSVIGDSTFMHSGLTGLAEMVYNPPPTGHVLIVLDNGTTAMTGQQEHPATGRRLDHSPTTRVRIEDVARAMGVKHVDVIDAAAKPEEFEQLLRQRLAGNDTAVIIARKPCILAAGKIRKYEKESSQ